MNAKQARKLSNTSQNYQRKHTSERIKRAAQNKESHIGLDAIGVILFEDDYLYFEQLGYKVQRPIFHPCLHSYGHSYFKFGVISW